MTANKPRRTREQSIAGELTECGAASTHHLRLHRAVVLLRKRLLPSTTRLLLRGTSLLRGEGHKRLALPVDQLPLGSEGHAGRSRAVPRPQELLTVKLRLACGRNLHVNSPVRAPVSALQ